MGPNTGAWFQPVSNRTAYKKEKYEGIKESHEGLPYQLNKKLEIGRGTEKELGTWEWDQIGFRFNKEGSKERIGEGGVAPPANGKQQLPQQT